MNATPRYEIFGLKTTTHDVMLTDGQTIYETPKTWELWDEKDYKSPRFLARFRKATTPFVLIDGVWHSE